MYITLYVMCMSAMMHVAHLNVYDTVFVISLYYVCSGLFQHYKSRKNTYQKYVHSQETSLFFSKPPEHHRCREAFVKTSASKWNDLCESAEN